MNINLLVYNILNENTYFVKKAKKKKVKDFNPKTNRMKKFKRNDYLETKIPPEKRGFKNRPESVRIQDWLGIKTEKDGSYGQGHRGQWCGWSHRGIGCFHIGKEITPDTCGNIKPEKTWIIKTDDEAKQSAKSYAKDIA